MKRRKALKTLSLGLGLPLGLSPLQALLAANASAIGKRLVLVELSGANDGLNTLVPVRNDAYYRIRPKLGLRNKDVIALNDELSLHKALKPMMIIVVYFLFSCRIFNMILGYINNKIFEMISTEFSSVL